MKTTIQKRVIAPIIEVTNLFLLLTLLSSANESNYRQHKIASIDEASGISYCRNSQTLIVANDEGNFYEISLKGEILSRHKLGDFDLEGVVCEAEVLIFAIEDGALLEVNRQSLQSKYLKLKGQKFKIDKKSGIEGITKIGDLYYLSIQAKKRDKAKILIVKKGENYAIVQKSINHQIIDSSGMEYHKNKLYIVSDKKDKLYTYNLQKNKIIKKIKLPKFAQEGITFDEEKNIFFADDNGAVLRYTMKELKLK